MRIGLAAPVAGGLLALGLAVVPAWTQSSAPALFTESQAARGQDAYRGACASCHGADLKGINDAPPLTGRAFVGAWGRQRVSDLFGFVTQSMPPSGPGSLGEDTTLDILAYMLRENGAKAGETLLKATTGTRIETVAVVPADPAAP